MRFKKQLMAVLVTAAASLSAFAADTSTTFDAKVIKESLSKLGFVVDTIEPAKMGLVEVVTNGGILYTNKDASYFIYGQMFENSGKAPVNLTEIAIAKINKALFDKADVEKDLVLFPAKDEKYKITVFTDTSCGYCVKLHSEVEKYNEVGITVQYLAYPRGGESAQNFDQMASIWCAEDKKEAMNLAKQKKLDASKDLTQACKDTVNKHLKLGESLGVSGTPAIFLDDGAMVSGYVPAERLIQMLDKKAASKKADTSKG